MSEFIPKEPRRIFLSYRNYAPFFSSIYGQYLLTVKPENFIHPDAFTEKVMKRVPNWSKYLATVKNFYPNSEIVVWDYGDVRSDWLPVFIAMFNRKIAEQMVVNFTTNQRVSMSGKSLAVFRKKLSENGAEMALANLRRIRNKYDKDQSVPFSLFTEDQMDILGERFERHKRLLQKSDTGLIQIY